MVLPPAVDLVLLVHRLVFEHQQRRERAHHVHRLAELDDPLLVLLGPERHQTVDLLLGPHPRQRTGALADFFDWDGLRERFAVELPGHRDALGRVAFVAVLPDGAQLFAVRE